MNENQISFLAPNGYIKPCQCTEWCTAYGIGCQGACQWCRNGQGIPEPKERAGE